MPKQYTCDICGYTTQTKSSLTAHKKRKTPCMPISSSSNATCDDPGQTHIDEMSAPATSEAPMQPATHVPQEPKEYVIQCVNIETSYLFCDTIYAFESLIKNPIADPEQHKQAQQQILANLVKVYYDIVNALQYKGKVMNDMKLRHITFKEV